MKDLQRGAFSTINARCETVRTAPTYREPFKAKRCIVPASGWYEWAGKEKRPMHMRPATNAVFGFAGLWDRWTAPDKSFSIISYTIVTTTAAESVRAYHERMPVVLREDQFDAWMRGTPDEAAELMVPYGGSIEAWQVDKAVGSPKNNSPDVMQPVSAGLL